MLDLYLIICFFQRFRINVCLEFGELLLPDLILGLRIARPVFNYFFFSKVYIIRQWTLLLLSMFRWGACTTTVHINVCLELLHSLAVQVFLLSVSWSSVWICNLKIVLF